MNVKRSCNCRSEKLTKETYNDFLFFELQQANKYGKDRVVVKRNGEITCLSLVVANELNLKIYALIRSGLNKISEIEHYIEVL